MTRLIIFSTLIISLLAGCGQPGEKKLPPQNENPTPTVPTAPPANHTP